MENSEIALKIHNLEESNRELGIGIKRLQEQFGDLDRRMEARFNDVPTRTEVYAKFIEFEAKFDLVIERLDNVPTRSEMYDGFEKIMRILQRLDNEQTITTHRLNNHEDRIETLEHENEFV